MKTATFLITSESGLVAASDSDSADKAAKNVADAFRLPSTAGLFIQPLTILPTYN